MTTKARKTVKIDGRTPLHDAAEIGDLEGVRRLILDRADIFATDRYGLSALHLAAREDHMNVVQQLVRGGADLNMQSAVCGWVGIVVSPCS